MAANVLTEAHTDTPCKYGTALHMNAPNRQPEKNNNNNLTLADRND